MSTNLQIKVGPLKGGKGSKGTRKWARGSPSIGPRFEYALFRSCGVEVRDGEDLKACLAKTLAERPLELFAKCCDKKALALSRQANHWDREEALMELYVAMRCSGKDHRDGIMAWEPEMGALVPYLRRGSVFTSEKLCTKEQKAPWGKTVSLDEPRSGSEADSARVKATTYLEVLEAKPEPSVYDTVTVASSFILTLPRPERLALTWSFGLNDEPRLSKREIGLRLACSEVKARQHYATGMSKLRSYLDA